MQRQHRVLRDERVVPDTKHRFGQFFLAGTGDVVEAVQPARSARSWSLLRAL